MSIGRLEGLKTDRDLGDNQSRQTRQSHRIDEILIDNHTPGSFDLRISIGSKKITGIKSPLQEGV